MMTICAAHIDSLILFEHFGDLRGEIHIVWGSASNQRVVKPGYTPLSNGNTQGSIKARVYW